MEEVVTLLERFRYVLLFPLAVVEGPIITVITGFLCCSGFLNVFVAYPVIVMGDVTGDSFYYALGHWSRKGFVKRLGEFFGLSQHRLTRMDGYFGNHFFRSVAISKIILGVGFTGLFIMGKLHLPYKKFVGFCFLVSLIQCGFYLIIGWFFGSFYAQINRYLGYFASLSIVLFLSILLIFFIRSKLKRHENFVRRQ